MTRSDLRVHINALGAVMGGAARHLGPFLDALHEARPDWVIHVWVYEGVDTSGWPDAARGHTVAWRSQVHRFRWENIDLPRELRAHDADVLINLTNSAPLRSPVPSVLYQRNPVWFDRAWLPHLGRRARAEASVRRALTFAQARGAAVVVTPSQAMADFLRSWWAWPSRVPVRVIHHAVDTARFAFVSRSWPPPNDRPLHLLAVSHDAPHKDQLLLIDLVDELRRRRRTSELVLTIDVTEPSACAAELLQRCSALGVGDLVHFVGSTQDVERLYADADLALSSSITESFGFPLIEAMAVGVPLVASDIPATAEVADGSAWLFPPGDVRRAADTVERVLALDDATMKSRLEQAARHAGTFTWTANVGAVAALVEDLVAARPDRVSGRWGARDRS